ncbi:MAG: IS1380 family transposase [Solirubrobacterales bacterium]|nr:IS1380 family transposase [Solirubrobacterales bacterium]
MVVNAGIVLAVTLGQSLGLEKLVDQTVRLGERAGASRPGRKVLSLVHAMLLGADCIDDCDVLRSGRTAAVLGHRPMAPSTLGTFLRSFTFGHVRQLDRVLAQALKRAWQAGAGPGMGRLVIDVDSFVGEVHGHAKQGAGYGYTHKLGYHPILATRADTSEVLHVRLRKGAANTQRGALRFVDELLARVRRAGASGQILLRADSGFWNKTVIARLRGQGCEFSIGVTMHQIVTAQIALIADDAWQPVADYPDSGVCELAETTLGEDRLIVRRVHLHAQDDQTELFAYWRHHAFITNRTEPIHDVDAEHRQHAQVELVIRDLKAQALAHFPSGHYSANSAWTVIACLAHNLGRWTNVLGLPGTTPRAAATLRRRLFSLPGRLTRTARRWTLHLPARWPWAQDFIDALTRIRALPHAA